MQGVGGTAQEINYYPNVHELFIDLCIQSNTKILISTIDMVQACPLIEPLLNGELQE